MLLYFASWWCVVTKQYLCTRGRDTWWRQVSRTPKSLYLYNGRHCCAGSLMELTPLPMVLHVTKAFFLSFFSFERYIRICFYCQLRETRVLSDDNVKYYKLFVILFPMLFYIPKCFEVRTGYVVHEKKMRIDCQKYLSLSQLLENPLLKPFIGGQFSEADLVKIEFLAKACNKIIRKLTKQRRFGSIPRQTPISFSCSFF